MGKKKQPHYRIVVADSRSPRDGRFVENLGYYNPLPTPALLSVDLSRVDYWLGQGASPSATVDRLVRRARNGGGGGVALMGAAAVDEGDAGENGDQAAGGNAEAADGGAGGAEAGADGVEASAAQPAGEAAAPEPTTDSAPGDNGATPEAAPA